MFYRPFNRSMGLWIINEFLKSLSYLFYLSNTQTTTFGPASFFQMLGLKIPEFPSKLYEFKNRLTSVARMV